MLNFLKIHRTIVWGLIVVGIGGGTAGEVLAFAAPPPEPVASWEFSAEESTPLRPHGGVHRDQPGPRPPEYPDFDASNTAVKFDGRGAYFSLEDSGEQSSFDFTNGETISLEAWVRVEDLNRNENSYIIGKGRTGSPGFAKNNQNWALRVRESGGLASVSFLFATLGDSDVDGSLWHRWTTKSGFQPGRGWHHVAITYRFGEPESMRGWIDGAPQPGSWDLAGPTTEAPMVDDDAIWIGSSQQGNPGNSFRGSLDSIAIFRSAFDDEMMKARYRRLGEDLPILPAEDVMPRLTELPSHRVRFSIHEGMPSHSRWLNNNEELPPETLSWEMDSFLLDRVPTRYDEWGIRSAWGTPVLLRMATRTQLPPGPCRLMMRVRGLGRLWVNGKVVARSVPLLASPNGEEPLTPVTDVPVAGMRIAEHRQQQVLGMAEVPADGWCEIVLEMIVGGEDFRPDPGETCVAAETIVGAPFTLLPAAGESAVSLVDTQIEAALLQSETTLQSLDNQRRRILSKSQDTFWEMRHAAAKTWVEEHLVPVPVSQERHPIDAFLQAKIAKTLQAVGNTPPEQAESFHGEVLPILRSHCFRCHGEKAQGGLLLNDRAALLRGGDSGNPIVIPGSLADSELVRRIRAQDDDERMPPGDQGLSESQIATLEKWIAAGAAWPAIPVSPESLEPGPPLNDAALLRRIYLDVVGVPPTEAEVRAFLADRRSDKRQRAIDRLLEDPRWADHWVSYWQDVLAENPTIINKSLNSTGPFRWFLYEALRDNKAMDRMVTELILLRGDAHEGGSAGFGIAGNNDAPFAAKGQIVASAFLGIDLQCARCHDSPYHSTLQRDLYALAAMFEQKSVVVPQSSRVPKEFFEQQLRESLIQVTLQPNEQVAPVWPFAEVTGCQDDSSLDRLLHDPSNTRHRLAGLLTAPQNTRFTQVIANRVWRRLMGAGLIESPDDWEGKTASHPELLAWLSQELMTHRYDVKHLTRLIMTSDLYQRQAVGENRSSEAVARFFVAPDRRRLTAEQLVDSLYASAGQPMHVEEFTFDPDGRRAADNRLTLGRPSRAWMFASLANERDRPSLSLPAARAVADVLEAFGWSGSRQNPRTNRETMPDLLQPGVLANGTASNWLTRITANGELSEVALHSSSPDEVVERLFLRYLSRFPSTAEREALVAQLTPGFESRILPPDQQPKSPREEVLPRVTWSNHLRPEANQIALEMEMRARRGPLPDPRLNPAWRERLEDVVWSIVNLSEFVWVP
ncbi:DUF1553 domain-containing protein [Aureliella helgolandensis]|uniref:Planctomycete cytochrome C n=1 Tax=Aureliella helgolandensis TaxID=2527968 RepID=A0A518G524_9BACT|nr:DUF1553 domain-containing protein [Aureliella helgolandensis]QDV23698.1 Planctomycete cytochrome C [Aureliella helgolandensis]